MKSLSHYLFLFSSILFSAHSVAERVPVNFNTQDKSLDQIIKFPDIKGDISTTINCSGVVQKNKKIKFFSCFKNQPGDEVYIYEIYKAFKKARFNPAQVNRKKEEALVQFRIFFKSEDNNNSINIINNIGYKENVDAYGINHIGAQRIIGTEIWQKHCPKFNQYNLLTKTHVNSEGSASSASIHNYKGIKISQSCNNWILSTLNSSKYIPAISGGIFVPSTHIEVFGN
tara:strand:+ start:949 stop:1632 length:684 start_codon:yes stop_codon:yes gene_type:complete